MPTYKQYHYGCPNCKTEQKHYAWDNEVNKKKHNCVTEGCKTKLTVNNIIEPEKPNVPGIRTDTKNRV